MTLKPMAAAVLLTCATAAFGAPTERTIPMDQVNWSFEGDAFGCTLTLIAGDSGQLQIRHDAGRKPRLVYDPVIRSDDHVHVSWQNSPWQQLTKAGDYTARMGEDHYEAGANAADSLMKALSQGHWLSIRSNDEIVRIPSIGWSKPAKEYHLCRYDVSPLSIAQARDQSLYFAIGQRSVSEKHLKQIQDIADYIALDPKVSKVLVDSYTDNTGNRLANLQLSRERAADVGAALRDAGVSMDIIETRGHGERYPSADNSTAAGRKNSRKVTIRIVRD